MEIVLLIGIQGAGKSTFYQQRFSTTHAQVSMDLQKTRFQEMQLMWELIQAEKSFVVDNTNVTRIQRLRYFALARESHIPVVGYYFTTPAKEAMARNNLRTGKARIHPAALFGNAKKLEVPTRAEGFARLWAVQTLPDCVFQVSELVE